MHCLLTNTLFGVVLLRAQSQLMNNSFFRVVAVFVWLTLSFGIVKASETVSFMAADGVKVFGEYYPASNQTAPFIICFHMAGANRGEYASIAPRLVKMGFQVLTIDQRSGGSDFGRDNQTVAGLGKSTDYGAAQADITAAIGWAKQKSTSSKVIIWGSSYSASLVILEAAQNSSVSAVLAFSPGEYLGGGDRVAQAVRSVSQPLFLTSTQSEAGDVAPIFKAAHSAHKIQFVPKGAGMHGSSALLSRDGAEYWVAVARFLSQFD